MGRSSVRGQSQSVDVGSSFDDYFAPGGVSRRGAISNLDFVSNSVEKIDDHTMRVSGDLKLLAITKPLTT